METKEPIKQRCPVEEQGILYHIVTKWSLSTKAISMLKGHFKSDYSAHTLNETLKMNKARVPSNKKQGMPPGITYFVPIYSNTSRHEIERDAKHSALKHQKYFLSFRYYSPDMAVVIIQRSRVNDYVFQRQKEAQMIHDRSLKTYYRTVETIEVSKL